MKVFVTGGSGFVGRQVVRRLAAEGYRPVCLVRPGSENRLPAVQGLHVRIGDVTDSASLVGALEGCEAVIHLVGIIREFPARRITFERLPLQATVNLLAAAEAQGLGRFLHMSANGAVADSATAYYRSKWQAEQQVCGSSLRWTLFRPSIIFGREDRFCSLLSKQIRLLPLVPVIGDGCYQLAPVAVEDVAAGFVAALRRPASEGRCYTVCGRQGMHYTALLDRLGEVLGVARVRKLFLPLPLLKPLVACLQNRPWFPLTPDLLTMLVAGNTGDPLPWLRDLDLHPADFSAALRRHFQNVTA